MLISGLAFSLYACKGSKASMGQSSQESVAEVPAEIPAEVPAANLTPPASITYLKMSRTGCFGTCPIYSVELMADGLALYHGVQFTEKKGSYEKQFPASSIQTLFSKFLEHRVDTCQSNYPAYIQDLPGLHFEIVYGSASDTQQIRHANFGPAYLKTLAEEVDKTIDPDFSWIKRSEEVEAD